MNTFNTGRLEQMRHYFDAGHTMPYSFRVQQLKALRNALLKYQGEIEQALFADLGKSAEEAWITETGFVLQEIRFALKHLKKWMRPEKVSTNLVNLPSSSRIHREPLGVVLIIAPWNYPLQLALSPLVGAIAAGNCVVVKPGETAYHTSALLQKIVEETFDQNHVAFMPGIGHEVLPPLLKEFRFDHIFYTGGERAGREIYKMAAEKLVPVTLELGGKSPCVVEADANLPVTANRIVVAKFSNAGQMCVAPDYLLVHESIEANFTKQLVDTLKKFYGDKPVGDYHLGKVIDRKHFERLTAMLEGANVVHGGGTDAEKLFIEPTLISNPGLNTAIMREEIFGPLLPIIPFKNFEEAKAIIDRHPNPLAFYVFTESTTRADKWMEQTAFGGGCVNNVSWHLANPKLPFGGRGSSGMGRYHGKYSFDTFSHSKSILRTPTWLDPAMRYPPFKGKLSLFKKLIR